MNLKSRLAALERRRRAGPPSYLTAEAHAAYLAAADRWDADFLTGRDPGPCPTSDPADTPEFARVQRITYLAVAEVVNTHGSARQAVAQSFAPAWLPAECRPGFDRWMGVLVEFEQDLEDVRLRTGVSATA